MATPTSITFTLRADSSFLAVANRLAAAVHATAITHPALPVLLRRAQAERDHLLTENIGLEAKLTRTENALHASRAQRDGLVAAYVGLIADCACAASSSKTATTE